MLFDWTYAFPLLPRTDTPHLGAGHRFTSARAVDLSDTAHRLRPSQTLLTPPPIGTRTLIGSRITLCDLGIASFSMKRYLLLAESKTRPCGYHGPLLPGSFSSGLRPAGLQFSAGAGLELIQHNDQSWRNVPSFESGMRVALQIKWAASCSVPFREMHFRA